MAAALARATMRRVEAVAAQAKRMTAEKAAVAKAHEDAKQDGLVEKTAGESGNAGWLRNKWVKFLASPSGVDVASRLAAERVAPTVEEAKLFSTWTYETRQKYSPVGAQGGGDSYGALQIPHMLAKFVFPLMKYEGFIGLTIAEAQAQNQIYCHELKEHWKALKVRQTDARVVLAP